MARKPTVMSQAREALALAESHLAALALILVATAMACGCGDHSCSPGDEDETVIGPMPAPLPGPGGPSDPGVDPGESDGDAYGYKRDATGDVCACDLRESEQGGCSKEPPPACNPRRGWNIKTGECAPPITSESPEVPHVSGKWLCTYLTICTIWKKWPMKEKVVVSGNGEGSTKPQAMAAAALDMRLKCEARGGITDWAHEKICTFIPAEAK
jgi:hypothetical protein